VIADGKVLDGKMTPEQARGAVRQQARDGVDFVKVYNGLPRDAYYAIADEAKRARVPFVGHTPDAITTIEAAAAGQRSIEHLDGVLLDCSPLAGWLRRIGQFLPDRRLLDSFDPARARTLFAAYIRYGTWHCPTLVLHRAAPPHDNPGFQYLPDWRPKPGTEEPKDPRVARAIEQKMMEVTAMMFRAGVRLLAGTDTGQPYVLPGFGLHEEMELMVAAGLPAAAVLRIATLAPAEFLGRENELGTVAPGRIADLVLLDADPLASIANSRLARAVVADGRLYERAELERLCRPPSN
jgi:hypothetical protein